MDTPPEKPCTARMEVQRWPIQGELRICKAPNSSSRKSPEPRLLGHSRGWDVGVRHRQSFTQLPGEPHTSESP